MTRGASAPTVRYDVVGARRAIDGIAHVTPLLQSPRLTALLGSPVLLKLENLQVTGSFKVRGAASRMLALPVGDRARGVVACSSGNHGRAVAYVAEQLGVPATVCVPEWVDGSKLEAIRAHGAETVREGKTYDEAEERARHIARDRRLATVHPFDDPHVVAGQGTIGLELLEQCGAVRTIIVPLSGGGLIAGIALAVKSVNPSVQVIGASAEKASVMVASLRHGHPVECPEESTVASALAGGIGLDNRHTFRLVRDYVDDHVLVSEDEILDAVAFAALEHKLVIEGGGAVGIAAALSRRIVNPSGDVIVVVSGGNVQLTAWWCMINDRLGLGRRPR